MRSCPLQLDRDAASCRLRTRSIRYRQAGGSGLLSLHLVPTRQNQAASLPSGAASTRSAAQTPERDDGPGGGHPVRPSS